MSKPSSKRPSLLKVTDDGKIRVVSNLLDLFVDHKSKNSKLSGTAIVQLDGTLLQLGLFIEVVPAEVDVSITEVTNEFVSGSGNVLHDSDLEESDEADDLSNSIERNGVGSLDGGNTVGEGIKGMSGIVDVSWEVDSGTGENVSKEGQLSDTSMLDFDVTKTIESFLVSAVEQTEGIPESKRRLDTKLVLESLEAGGGRGVLGRSESSGGGDEGGENGGLHGVRFDFFFLRNCESEATRRGKKKVPKRWIAWIAFNEVSFKDTSIK